MKLVGDTAIVTGGAMGIGRGCADLLMAHGASVVIADRDLGAAVETAKALSAKHDRKAIAVHCDVASAVDVERMVQTAVSELGSVSILVNNAGTAGRNELIWEMSEADWDHVVDVCMKGTFLCTKAVLNEMVAKGTKGAIVNVSSLAYIAATNGASAYSAAKAGISQLTQVVASETGPYGIRVNAVAPGSIRVERVIKHMIMEGPYGKEFLERTPLGRFGEPEDVARVVVFLASDYAQWVTGSTILVDGGLHIRGLHDFHRYLHSYYRDSSQKMGKGQG